MTALCKESYFFLFKKHYTVTSLSYSSRMYLLADVDKTQYPQIFYYLTGKVFWKKFTKYYRALKFAFKERIK